MSQCTGNQAVHIVELRTYAHSRAHIWELQKLLFCIVFYGVCVRTPPSILSASAMRVSVCVYISLWESYKISKWEFIIWNAGNMWMHDASGSLSPSLSFFDYGYFVGNSFALPVFLPCSLIPNVCFFPLPRFVRLHFGLRTLFIIFSP